MSIEINVVQQPLSITPSNGEHIWNFSTTGSTLNNFKFIIEVFFRPSQVDYSVIDEKFIRARLKVRPNKYGNAIVDLSEIVTNFLKPNPRYSGSTYPTSLTDTNYYNFVAQENRIITLSDFQYTTPYNAFNLWSPGCENLDMDELWHVEQYQVKVGYEYFDNNGDYISNIDYFASYQPDPINIFPGVDNSLIPKQIMTGMPTDYFANENVSWLYHDLFRHFYVPGEDNVCSPREFLNAAGRKYKVIEGVSDRVRRRKHHPDCPIIMSFLDGQNEYFTNNSTALVVRGAIDIDDPYTYLGVSLNNPTLQNNYDIFKMGVFYLPYNVSYNQQVNNIPEDSKKVCFYLTNSEFDYSFNARTSEVMEFYMEDRSCINNPVHLLFLNSRGMWDTYTFDGKSEKVFNKTSKTFRQESSLNKEFYNRGSAQRGTTVYDTDYTYNVNCTSWYMDENETEIVEELFMSSDVYIIEGTEIDYQQCLDCNDLIRLYQNLIPVVIKDTRFIPFQKQYQKLFQYKFTLEYSGIKRMKTQR